jgi:hypothetical protein
MPSLQRIEMAAAAAATPAPGEFIFSGFFFGSTNNFFLQLNYMRVNYNGDNEHRNGGNSSSSRGSRRIR